MLARLAVRTPATCPRYWRPDPDPPAEAFRPPRRVPGVTTSLIPPARQATDGPQGPRSLRHSPFSARSLARLVCTALGGVVTRFHPASAHNDIMPWIAQRISTSIRDPGHLQGEGMRGRNRLPLAWQRTSVVQARESGVGTRLATELPRPQIGLSRQGAARFVSGVMAVLIFLSLPPLAPSCSLHRMTAACAIALSFAFLALR